MRYEWLKLYRNIVQLYRDLIQLGRDIIRIDSDTSSLLRLVEIILRHN